MVHLGYLKYLDKGSTSKVDWIGASIVPGQNGEEALCLLLGPCDAYSFVLPAPSSERSAAPAEPAVDGLIWSWFRDEQNLCLTTNAKDLVGAFLKRGIDVQCSLAEPRIAHWLLDPDDKENMSIANLASLCQITLEGNTLLAGSGNSSVSSLSLSPVLRARLATAWPEAFVALPLLAELLRRCRAAGIAWRLFGSDMFELLFFSIEFSLAQKRQWCLK